MQCILLSPSSYVVLSAAGWSGSGGLGAKEQGIQDPIKGGDIRDKWDQYKGVGVSLDDPYENYRRNKSYNFVARMKAREEGTHTDFNIGLQKYSPPLNFSTFCHVLTTNINVFCWDFI